MAPSFERLAASPRPKNDGSAGISIDFRGRLGPMMSKFPQPPDVQQKRKGVDTATPGPALVHAHGGGMAMGTVPLMEDYIGNLVQETGTQIFSVEHQRAPEHPFPTPAEDCYASLVWVTTHADQFSIDPHRIGTMG
ncbi:hypothetical protein N7532_008444 [Penicillium argentinense]|uniref:Alpha/beta hydrolase fold-3 domain-containing protein n=1 Tax=Penicillium argentinense TaxID=1131581 RepID=A0A9W9K1W7_9EURO|nr:uncharacterized protein N7532_008444 [Penicillium argentinense]KAJ5089760.1 hypothetical protein N7532_008444 [Penicillium argentinense]